MKKLINDPSGLVREMLEARARQAPGTALLGDEHVLVRSDLPAAERRPVAVISGGGSGHEPAHAGYVGAGMLSAAVCGEVFTSPSTDAVLAAIRATAGPNRGLADRQELHRRPVELRPGRRAGPRRGHPGGDRHRRRRRVAAPAHAARTSAGHRRHRAGAQDRGRGRGPGAAAGAGRRRRAQAAAQLGSMGVALGGCTLPGAEKSGFTLADNEIELGLGIHGERASSAAPCCRPTS